AVADIAPVFNTTPHPPHQDRLPPAELARIRRNLRSRGILLEDGIAADERLHALRRMYEPYVHALSESLPMPLPARAVAAQAADTTKAESFAGLKAKLDQLDKELGLQGNRLFYLAVAPDLVRGIVEKLHAAKMLHHDNDESWVRVVFEKPFGRDLKSAQRLNKAIRRVLHENQIFRIDHYLGKE